MNFSRRFILAFKALHELGPAKMGQFAWYRLGLRSGYLRRQTRVALPPGSLRLTRSPIQIHPLISIPTREQLVQTAGNQGLRDLLAEANEICYGKVRLFGGEAVALQLVPPGKLKHWSAYQEGWTGAGGSDIKFIWEPARFGWAYTLGRAFIASGDERYPAAFWQLTETFLDANPPNAGPNWASAQEVALRLMAFSFALQVFAAAAATTPDRVNTLVEAILQHARRIPPTLAYARAQNNNHLLVEAAGLFTAGCLLPKNAYARSWQQSGWRIFNAGLQGQIDASGAYVQQSTNYHRLMLQVALWVREVAASVGVQFPEDSLQALGRATRWLAELVDQSEGRVPNLGPNDGANILPLACGVFHDYRPTVQAAALAFLQQPAFPPGPWDEMQLWLGAGLHAEHAAAANRSDQQSRGGPAARPTAIPAATDQCILRSPRGDTWAYLRAARFHDRPGHADQLHLDLWWRGLNIAQDAGTYLYNAPPPWDNALARAFVHNTVTINGQDQMTRASRFLYLDWAQAGLAQASLIPGQPYHSGNRPQLTATHNGYRRLGVTHRRRVRLEEPETALATWIVEDRLEPESKAARREAFSARLHWLLPDWDWNLENNQLSLESPYGRIELTLSTGPQSATPARLQLVRAGEVLWGDGDAAPEDGWVSPTYATKIPALSFILTTSGALPLLFTSEWHLPNTSHE